MMNAVIYARFSSHAQNEQSIEGQLAECYDFARRNGYNVICEYIDRAMTGKNDKRKDFQRMISDSEKKAFNFVIVYQLDRFARNRLDSLLYKEKLKENGVRVLSARENVTDDASGVLIESVLEGMAEYYSAELSQKVVRGMGINAKKHLSNGGSIPLGFRVDNEKHFQIDKSKSVLVQEIFERYANGDTCAEICKSLNERGHKTAHGSSFNKNSLCSILKNKKYIGTYFYDGYEAPNAIPRIVSDELFNRVQERLQSNQKAPSRVRAKDEYLLTTKLFCGECKAMMTGVSGTGKNGTKHHYYSCNTARLKKGECKKRNVRKALIEDCVIKKAITQLTPDNIDTIAKEVVAVCKREKENSELTHLETELRTISKQKENLMAALRNNGSDEMVSKMVFEELHKLADNQTSLEKQLAVQKQYDMSVTEPEIKFFLSYLAKGDINDIRYRKALINIFVNRIYLYDDGRVSIYFNTKNGVEKVSDSMVSSIEGTLASGSRVGQNGSPF